MPASLRLAAIALICGWSAVLYAEDSAWPPPLKGVKNNQCLLTTPKFLEIPEAVQTGKQQPGAADFIMAKTPPTVRLAFHDRLGEGAATRRLWSSWGDICLASDGKVYCGIGDHGNDAGGDARCFLYVWDPQAKTLQQIVDMNQVFPPRAGQPAWSKMHAKIDEGKDGLIYFSCTLNDGNRAGDATKLHWTEQLPGGQLYSYDPKSGKVAVVATLPAAPRCTATSLLDRERNTWWCNLESGGNALWGFDLAAKKTHFLAPDGSMGFNRAFAIGADGSVYFNGAQSLWKYDRGAGKLVALKATFEGSPGMRSASRESKDGHIYGTTHATGQLFKYSVAKDEVALLGPTWMLREYTTVVELSPDERFLYYLPGAHGGAFKQGTPVLQYELATGRRKVLAFLAPAFEAEHEYLPAGTYGMKVSADGGTLYVNFNGHPIPSLLPKHIRPTGFGLCSFAEIQIPASER